MKKSAILCTIIFFLSLIFFCSLFSENILFFSKWIDIWLYSITLKTWKYFSLSLSLLFLCFSIVLAEKEKDGAFVWALVSAFIPCFACGFLNLDNNQIGLKELVFLGTVLFGVSAAASLATTAGDKKSNFYKKFKKESFVFCIFIITLMFV